MNKTQSGMEKFWSVFEHYKRLLLAAGAASFLPFVAEFADASPPIPSISPITSLLLVITAVLVFQFFENSTRKKVNSRISMFVLLGTLALFGYFWASTRFIFSYDGGRIILGCGWTTRAEELAVNSGIPNSAQCPGQYQDLLSDFGGSVAKVFMSQNLAYVEMLLISTWLFFFMSVAAIIALFVTFQQGRTIKAG